MENQDAVVRVFGKKARVFANDLVRQGCAAVVFVHDLDRDPENGELNDEGLLRERIGRVFDTSEVPRYICIPKEELEAWFWADIGVLRRVARDPQYVTECHEPESKKKPKEALMRLSRSPAGKARYSTNDNPLLAEHLDLEACARKCSAFRGMRDFVLEVT